MSLTLTGTYCQTNWVCSERILPSIFAWRTKIEESLFKTFDYVVPSRKCSFSRNEDEFKITENKMVDYFQFGTL
jgi:hypothetical protein